MSDFARYDENGQPIPYTLDEVLSFSIPDGDNHIKIGIYDVDEDGNVDVDEARMALDNIGLATLTELGMDVEVQLDEHEGVWLYGNEVLVDG